MVTMKIYNEVVYQIVDNQLVKVSEDSFDYEGDVSKCKGGGGTTGKIIKKAAKVVDPIIRDEMVNAGTNLYDSTGGFIADQATKAAKNNNMDLKFEISKVSSIKNSISISFCFIRLILSSIDNSSS